MILQNRRISFLAKVVIFLNMELQVLYINIAHFCNLLKILILRKI